MTLKKHIKPAVIVFLILLFPLSGRSQSIDHWEALVLAENTWKFRIGNSEPPLNWFQSDFNDALWLSGPGGIGYGDNDDATIIDSTYSIYLRKEFNVIDSSMLSLIYFFADYDDAFVAYLNGVEICRANIGTIGVPPTFDASTYEQREARLYRGMTPESFLIDKSHFRNGSNLLAVQVNNNSSNSSDLSSLMFLFAGVQDGSYNYQALPDWFETPTESSNLPILIVNTNGQEIQDEPKITATLKIIDNGVGNINFLTDSANGYNGEIGIEVRGHSSQQFPKKNYGFETRSEDGSNNNVSLLGLPEENDWVLHGPYSDKSLMRNVLSYHIGRLTGEYAARTRWCELYINGDYRGVYVLTEKIKRDKNRVDISKLDETDTSGVDLTGGYIISIDRDEGPGSGWQSPNYYNPFYQYRYPKNDEITDQQKAYIQNHIGQLEQLIHYSSSSEAYSQFFDIPSFVNYWIATEIFKNLDNYKFSFFMHKTKDDKGGKLHFGPIWDLDLAYGNYDVDGYEPEGWSYIWARRPYLSPWIIDDLSADTLIQNQIHCRWRELRQDVLRTDNLLSFIDNQAILLEEAQARNFNRWPILGTNIWPNAFVGDTYQEEIQYLKTWLSNRLDWMDENMVGKCGVSSIATDDEHSAQLPQNYKLYQNYPNPFNPTTKISYDIPATTNVSLDIYDLKGNKIFNIYNGDQEAGSYSFDLNLNYLTSGMYIYRLTTNEWMDSRKMVYIK